MTNETSGTAGAPLQGVVVLDLTQIYNGPYATFLMAMAGADVVKIEPPDGEHLRRRPNSGGTTEPFAVLNANKRSLVLDLKTDVGRQVLLELVRKADVLVENYAPGVMARLNLGADTLHQTNPRLVIASGNGYGAEGAYRDFTAMDLTVQAMSGVLSVTGHPDQEPVKAGPAIADFFGGIHLYGAIVTALYKRQQTGEGSCVEVAMMDALVPSLMSNLGLHNSGELQNLRTGNAHGGLLVVPYNVYPVQDGGVAILAVSDQHWLALGDVLEYPDLVTDPRFVDKSSRVKNRAALDARIGELTIKFTKQMLFDRLVAARVPSAPVRSLDEVINDEHLHARGMLKWTEHPVYGRMLAMGSPLRFSDYAGPRGIDSHELGADSQEVLAQMASIKGSQFDELARAGAFGKK